MQKPLVFVGAGMYWFVAWRDEEKRKKREREKNEKVSMSQQTTRRVTHTDARENRERASEA